MVVFYRTVNAIEPGLIRSPLLEGLASETIAYMVSKVPMGRTGTVDEAAALVHDLASREAGFTTGQCYDIRGGRATCRRRRRPALACRPTSCRPRPRTNRGRVRD